MDEAASASCAPASSALEESSPVGCCRLFFPRRTDTEKDSRNEKAGKSGPFKPESVLTDVGVLVVVPEVISALDVSGSHQRSIDSLEEGSDQGQETTQITTNPGAQGQEASE